MQVVLARWTSGCRGFAVAQRVPWIWPYGGLGLVLSLVLWPAWVSADRMIVGGDTTLIHYPYFVLWRDALAAGELPFWNPYTFSGIPAFSDPPGRLWLSATLAVQRDRGYSGDQLADRAARAAGRARRRLVRWSAWGAGLRPVPERAGLRAGQRDGGPDVGWPLQFRRKQRLATVGNRLAMQSGRRGAVVYLALVIALMILAGNRSSCSCRPGGCRCGRPGQRCERRLEPSSPGAAPLRPWHRPGGGAGRLPAPARHRAAGRLEPPGRDELGFHDRDLAAALASAGGARAAALWRSPIELLAGTCLRMARALTVRGPGAVARRHAGERRQRWLCLGATALAVALAFGRYLPGYGWMQLIPGDSSFRVPSKHLTLAALALALAGGLGLRRLQGRAGRLRGAPHRGAAGRRGVDARHLAPGHGGPARRNRPVRG